MSCDMCDAYHKINPESPCMACQGAADVAHEEPDTTSLDQAVGQLREARRHTALLAEQVDGLMAAFNREHAVILASLKAARAAQAEKEQHVRELRYGPWSNE